LYVSGDSFVSLYDIIGRTVVAEVTEMAFIEFQNASVFRSLRPNWKKAGSSSKKVGKPLLTDAEIEACSSIERPASVGQFSAFEVKRERRPANDVLQHPR
jgi:hypothetical protein